MSKQKDTEKPDTGNEVQAELEGISTVDAETSSISVEPDVTIVEKPKKSKIEVNTVATMSVKGNKKMGVYKFLSIYPQNIYISSLLQLYYPHSFFTKDEWFMRIDEILNSPINN